MDVKIEQDDDGNEFHTFDLKSSDKYAYICPTHGETDSVTWNPETCKWDCSYCERPTKQVKLK